jgi:hypothetical protein
MSKLLFFPMLLVSVGIQDTSHLIYYVQFRCFKLVHPNVQQNKGAYDVIDKILQIISS